jgi:hypothetical protein
MKIIHEIFKNASIAIALDDELVSITIGSDGFDGVEEEIHIEGDISDVLSTLSQAVNLLKNLKELSDSDVEYTDLPS